MYCTVYSRCAYTFIFMCTTGLVFLAFAFNMVDCGGILGGRLGKDMNIHAASLKKSKVRPCCATDIVICMFSQDRVALVCQAFVSTQSAIRQDPQVLIVG